MTQFSHGRSRAKLSGILSAMGMSRGALHSGLTRILAIKADCGTRDRVENHNHDTNRYEIG